MQKIKASSLAVILMTVVAGAGETKANILNNLLGSWRNTAIIYQNGSRFGTSSGTSKITRNGSRGFYIVSNARVNNQPAGISHTWFYDNGICAGYVRQGSKTLGNFSGTWSATKTTLTYSVGVSSPTANYTQRVTTKLVTKRKLTSISTTSNGIKLIGTATR